MKSKRFVTLVLATGVLVLIVAIALGERMGDRVLIEASDSGSSAQSPLVTPLPESTATGDYGPNWKQTQVLAAAADPKFPDPRVPPKPLPTLAPPSPTPKPSPTWTPNPKLPIWDQTPPQSTSPSPSPSPSPTPDESTVIASPQPIPTF